MKIKPVMIPDVGINWGRPVTKTTTQVVEIALTGDSYQDNLLRLEAKYGRALSRKEMAHELKISPKTLDRRIANCEDLPEYKELKTGAVIFPLIAIATYLSQGLVRTA